MTIVILLVVDDNSLKGREFMINLKLVNTKLMDGSKRVDIGNNMLLNLAVESILKVDIEYTRWDGKKIVLCKGFKIYVDALKGMAEAMGDHFEIEPFEYEMCYPH